MYDKLRMLIKPMGFVVMIALFVIGTILGGITFKWALLLAVTYCVLQLTGFATKKSQDVIDSVKEKANDAKEEFDYAKEDINNKLKK